MSSKRFFLLIIHPIFLYLFAAGSAWSQTYTLVRPVDDSLLGSVKLVLKEVFEPNFEFEYSCTGYDLFPKLEKVPKGINYTTEYKTQQEEALKVNQQNAYAWNNLGNYYVSNSNSEAAKEYFLKALQYLDKTISKDSSLFYSFRGAIRMNLGIEGSQEDFEKAISMNPTDSLAVTFLPFIITSKREFKKGKKYCAEQMQRTTDYSQANWFLTFFFVDFLEKYSALNTDSISDAQFYRTDIDQLLDLSETENLYQKYKKNPKITLSYNLVMILPYSLRFFAIMSSDSSIQKYTPNELRKLAELRDYFENNKTPVNKFTRLKTLAYITLLEGHLDAAADQFQKAIAVFPQQIASDNFNIGLCQKALLSINELKHDDAANISLLSEMVEMYRNKNLQPLTLTNLAACYLQQDDFENFKKYAEQAEKCFQNNCDALRYMAHVCFVENDSQVNYYLGKASEQIVNDAQYFNLSCQIALYFLALGDAAQAHTYFQQAREVYPSEGCELCDRAEKEFIKVE